MATSVEKLEAQLQRLADAKGEDAGQRMLLHTARSLLPALRKLGFIPQDAAELDIILHAGARWMLELRSDDAPAVTLEASPIAELPA